MWLKVYSSLRMSLTQAKQINSLSWLMAFEQRGEKDGHLWAVQGVSMGKAEIPSILVANILKLTVISQNQYQHVFK
jgi:hypothetical protein